MNTVFIYEYIQCSDACIVYMLLSIVMELLSDGSCMFLLYTNSTYCRPHEDLAGQYELTE